MSRGLYISKSEDIFPACACRVHIYTSIRIYTLIYMASHTDHRQTQRAVTQTQAEPTESPGSLFALSRMEVY